MKQFVLKITIFLCYLNISYAQSIETPSTLPEVKYHLTARPWQALNISKDDYLDRVEGVVRQIARFQSSTGQIIDPYANYEIQYATPYFANAVGTLISAGRAMDLLDKGIAAMNNSTADIAHGSSSIPQDHGEFFVAPLSSAIPLYTSHVSTAQMNYPGACPLGILKQPQLIAIYLLIFLFSTLILHIFSYHFFRSILSYCINIISTRPNISSP